MSALPHLGLGATRRWFDALRGAVSAASTAEPLDMTLNAAADALLQLNRHSDRTFTSLGRQLMGLLEAMRAMETSLGEINAMIAGGECQQSAETMLGIVTYSNSIMDSTQRGGERLAELRKDTEQLQSVFAGFRKTVSVFICQGSLTRIETARVGSRGVDIAGLADEVQRLAGEVKSKAEFYGASAQAIDLRLRQAIDRIDKQGREESREIHTLLDEAATAMDDLKHQCENAAQSSGEATTNSRKVIAALEDLVPSIQLQDVTRQPLEHVIAVLRELARESKGARRAGASQRDMVRLQAAQIEAATGQLFEAIPRIVDNLGAIRSSAATMEQCGEQIQGSASGDGAEPIFVKLERSLVATRAEIAHCEELTSASVEMAREIESDLSKVEAAAGEIRGLDFQIQRVALNAGINSAQLGVDGEPLGAIAMAMQALAAEALEHSSGTERVLAGMRETLDAVRADVSLGNDHELERDRLFSHIEKSLETLRASAERCSSNLARSHALSIEVQRVIGEVQQEFEALERERATVDATVARLRELAQASVHEADAATLRGAHALHAVYTAESEREVHLRLAGEQTPQANTPDEHEPALATAPAGSEFGDNIDLF